MDKGLYQKDKNLYQNGTRYDVSSYLLFHYRRTVTYLFKMFLIELEEMADEKLISEEYFKKQRKIILDSANSYIREFEEELDKYDIRIKR